MDFEDFCTCGHGVGAHFGGCDDCDSCDGYRPKKTHQCRDGWVPLHRLQLALLDSSDVADESVCVQLSDCARCWKSVALQAISLLANARALNYGSKQEAADATAREIQRVLGIT